MEQPDPLMKQEAGGRRSGGLTLAALRAFVAVVDKRSFSLAAQALGVTQLRIGPQIDPGVPWCHAESPARPDGLHLALKSGNFGGVDFFTRAFATLAPA